MADKTHIVYFGLERDEDANFVVAKTLIKSKPGSKAEENLITTKTKFDCENKFNSFWNKLCGSSMELLGEELVCQYEIWIETKTLCQP